MPSKSQRGTAHSTITVIVFRVERAPSSANGNPAYFLHTSEGRWRTQSDSSIAYGIGNPGMLRIREGFTTRATLHLTPRGRVFNVTDVTHTPDGAE